MRLVRVIIVAVSLLLGAVGSSFAQDNDNSIIVEVVNTAGQPVKNACVTFVPKVGDIVFRKAGDSGKVKVKKLSRGNYRVVVKVDGYVAQKKEVVVAEGKGTVAFVMEARN